MPGEYQVAAGQTACERCPAGQFCTSDRIFGCPRATYNVGADSPLQPTARCLPAISCPVGRAVPHAQPLFGQTFATACLSCPEFSTTLNSSSASREDCVCLDGFDKTPSGACACAEGFEIADGTRCQSCPIGQWKSNVGNGKCHDCPVVGTTTAAAGATSQGLCVCDVGLYADVTLTEQRANASFECRSCTELHADRFSQMTNCTTLGVTLDRIPLRANYWRQNALSRIVRHCDKTSACMGGDTAGDASCAPGHHGPLCDVCQPPTYFGGRDSACKLCSEAHDLGAALAIVAGVLAVLLAAAVSVYLKLGKWITALLKDGSTDALRTRNDRSMTPKAMKKAQGSSPFCARLIARLQRVMASIGIKARILISLFQVRRIHAPMTDDERARTCGGLTACYDGVAWVLRCYRRRARRLPLHTRSPCDR
jgi:hypothetical protein